MEEPLVVCGVRAWHRLHLKPLTEVGWEAALQPLPLCLLSHAQQLQEGEHRLQLCRRHVGLRMH